MRNFFGNGTTKVMGKSVILGILIFSFFALIYSTLLSYTNINDQNIKNMTQMIVLLSIVGSSIYGSAVTKKKGWLFGVLIGLIFFALTYLMSAIGGGSQEMGIEQLMKLGFYAVVGIIGGMIGVNISK